MRYLIPSVMKTPVTIQRYEVTIDEISKEMSTVSVTANGQSKSPGDDIRLAEEINEMTNLLTQTVAKEPIANHPCNQSVKPNAVWRIQ